MRVATLDNIVIMLTVYIAALFWAMQHVADRYTSKIIPSTLRSIALRPFLLLVGLLVLSGFLVLRPLPHLLISFLSRGLIQPPAYAGDIIAFFLLFGAVIVVTFAGYRLVQQITDGKQMIIMAKKQPDQHAAIQEILLNAIQRTDQHVVSIALPAALGKTSSEREDFLNWLLDHHDLFAAEWLLRELLKLLFSKSLNESTATSYSKLLCLLLTAALDIEAFHRAKNIMVGTMSALTKSTPWVHAHAELLYEIGFNLCKVGVRGTSIPRIARIPGQLDDIKDWFISWIRRVWDHIQELKDSNAVEAFSSSLGKLAIETSEEDFCESILSRIYDVMEKGFEEHLLTADTLQQLASDLGHVRRGRVDDKQTQEHIDSLVIDLGAMLVELGEDEEALGRLVTDGNLWQRHSKQHLNPRCYWHEWLKPTSYQAVAKCIGLRNFKDQPKEKTKTRSEGIEILLDSGQD